MKEHALTPAVFYVLLALAPGRKHGYGIMQDARGLSDGAFIMGPATLYTTIQRLLELSFIEEADGPPDADSRRRYYQLTREGRAALNREVNRMESAVLKARAMDIKPARSRG
jgi:DNA-binding PadR family transcriptional regulator